MSNRLSLEDERHKIRQYMAAPVYIQPPSTTQRLVQGPTLTVPHINLAHYPEHVDHPMVWRAIREAVYQRRPFTMY